MLLKTHALVSPLLLLLFAKSSESRVVNARSSSLSSRHLVPRDTKPKDEYTQHSGPIRWAALGDSYTAGPGAGDRWKSQGGPCMRTVGSYAVQLDQDFPWDRENEFSFLACTGNKINDVVDRQVPALSSNKDTRTDFVVMTVGGNDIEFGDVVKICALNIGFPWGRNCEEQLKATKDLIDGDDIKNKMFNLYDKIFEKLDLDDPDEHYQLYHILYPSAIINWANDGAWCNDKTFYDECSNIVPTVGPKLIGNLRYDLNHVLRSLNVRLRKIRDEYIERKRPAGRYDEWAPGWNRNRLHMDEAPDYYGHEFCLQDTRSLDDPNVYIQPYCDRAKGENYDSVTQPVAQFSLDPDKCNSTAEYKQDQNYAYSCQVAISGKYHPAEFPGDKRMMVPESWAKVFHPRPNGFGQTKKDLSETLLYWRPTWNSLGDSSCEKNDVEVKPRARGQKRPDNFSLCPAKYENPPKPDDKPSGPTKTLHIVAAQRPNYPNPRDRKYKELLAEMSQIRWKFFQADYWEPVGCDSKPLLDEVRRLDTKATNYPGGIFNLKLYGQDCQYKNSGNNPGALFCGDKTIECRDDPMDKNPSDPKADKGRYTCEGGQVREPVFLCAW